MFSVFELLLLGGYFLAFCLACQPARNESSDSLDESDDGSESGDVSISG